MPSHMQNSLIFHYNLKFYGKDTDNYEGISLKRFVMQVEHLFITTGGPCVMLFLILRISHSIRILSSEVKGQTKSKRFFQADVSSKKRTNEFYFNTKKPQIDMFSFVFWRKLKTTKRHFEIN